jgi:hypothetical protein
MTPLEQPISHLLQLTKSLLNEASVTPFPANCLELIQHTLSSQKHLSFRRMDHQGVANLFIYTKGTRNWNSGSTPLFKPLFLKTACMVVVVWT